PGGLCKDKDGGAKHDARASPGSTRSRSSREASEHSLAIETTDTSSSTLPAGLTKREAEVLRLIARGLTNAQIAEQPVISPVTVNSYLRSIYGKLGVSSRTRAMRYAIDHNLI